MTDVSRRKLLAASPLALLPRQVLAQAEAPPGRARRLIFVVLNGGLSQVDSFDPKPALTKYAGKSTPASAALAKAWGAPLLLQPSPWKSRAFGEHGVEISELFPGLGALVDRFWLFRSMNTRSHQHAPALRELVTGHPESGHPALGAWLANQFGPESPTLPPFVALGAGRFSNGDELWSAGCLPATCAGAYLPLDAVARWEQAGPPSSTGARARDDFRKGLDDAFVKDAGFSDLGAQEERARRERALGPVARRLWETPSRLDYGTSLFARGCRLACDLVEQGVRTVQLFHGADATGAQAFDCHDNLTRMEAAARSADKALAALTLDLERRGLLDQTMLVVATEFGRAPVASPGAGPAWGRPDSRFGFSVLLTGSHLKAGRVWGTTDELGLRAAEKVMAPQDLLASVLSRFRVDPDTVTYRRGGHIYTPVDRGSHVIRDFRLG